MATLNLGNIKFNWKGAYAGGTAYVVDDVVSYSGSSYICKLASTGNLPTDGTYWDQMSSAGTNGTDLTSTLTTQGDVLYRDGSGLQRLAAGTAGQVLQTGGAGANVSWGTVSSDVVKLASGAFSTSADNLIIDGFTNSIYKSYMLRMQSASTNNSGNSIRLRFRSGSSDLNSEYLRAGSYTGVNTSSSGTGSFNNLSSYNQDHYPFGHHGSTDDDINFAEIVFNDLTDTSIYKCIHSRSIGRDGSSQWTHWINAGVYRPNTNAVTGVKIYTGSGNFTITGSYELYGFKA